MPDNRSRGILEDFLYLLLPPESRLFAHVQASVGAIPQEDVRFSAPGTEPKVLLHTWLAWQERPGVPFWHCHPIRLGLALMGHKPPPSWLGCSVSTRTEPSEPSTR